VAASSDSSPSGYKALHDEDLIYGQELKDAQSVPTVVRAGMDWYAFTLAFKGTFLEGLEVAFTVLIFGTAAGNIPLASVGAVGAIVLVGVVGVAVHQPLSQVPENTMKFAVGVMLTTFGIFFAGEGVGVAWPGEDASLLGILAFILIWSLVLVAWLKRQHAQNLVPAQG